MRRFAPDGPGAAPAPTTVPSPLGTTSGRTTAALEGLLRFFVAPPAPRDGSAGREDVLGRAGEETVSGEPPALDDASVAGDLPVFEDASLAGDLPHAQDGLPLRGGAVTHGEVPLADGAVSEGEAPLGGRRRPDGEPLVRGRRRRKPGRSLGARPRPEVDRSIGARPRSQSDRSLGARPRPESDRSIGERPREGRGAAGGRAPRIVVVGGASDVRAAAGAIASRVAAARGCATGVVVSWPAPVAAGEGDDARAPHGGPVLARGGAVRLAAELAERGHDARATGRLVQVRLGEGPGAVAEAERVQDAAGEAPVVLALEGARGKEWDRMLPAQDLVLLAAGPRVPEALARVALGVAQDRCGDTPVRLLAVSAGRRPRPARAALAEVVALVEAR